MSTVLTSNMPVRSPFGGLTELTERRKPYPWPWVAVRQRFEAFDRDLGLTALQKQDGMRKGGGVVACLNRHYYGSDSGSANAFLVGSWGKGTAMRPPRDVDLYFLLPASVYHRFQGYRWNRQSAVLQEVKDVLQVTYPATDMRGDGQVVVVLFDSFNVEVVPAFKLDNGQYWICNTHDGGSYKASDVIAEWQLIETIDSTSNRNLRPLIRMLKSWQAHCSVPIKSFELELVAADFLQQSPWRNQTFFYFDWIMRDFFLYLLLRAGSRATVPGTLEAVFLGNEWQSRAQSAYDRALQACEYEYFNRIEAAGEEWPKNFR